MAARASATCVLRSQIFSAGQSREAILEDYPYLEGDDIDAALAFAARQTDHPIMQPNELAFSGRCSAAACTAGALRGAGFEAVHVADIGLVTATDQRIWQEAVTRSAVLVTKDRDFPLLRVARNDGPTILWVRVGNIDNRTLIAQVLRALPSIVAAAVDGGGKRDRIRRPIMRLHTDDGGLRLPPCPAGVRWRVEPTRKANPPYELPFGAERPAVGVVRIL
jgi:predicted nuclease of predicted toxin-antitoxin system